MCRLVICVFKELEYFEIEHSSFVVILHLAYKILKKVVGIVNCTVLDNQDAEVNILIESLKLLQIVNLTKHISMFLAHLEKEIVFQVN